MSKLVKRKISKSLSLRQFKDLHNKVLIYRNIGGLGDILMHRMAFEDFKKMNPEMEVIFACPPQFIDAVKDHPYVDTVVNFQTIEMTDYVIAYNTSTCCTRYEMGKAPLADKHRSDIWANHCGVELKTHNMHINLTDQEKEFGLNWLAKNNIENKPAVFFSPVSAMPSKNLQPHQVKGAVEGLRKLGLFVYSSHIYPVKNLDDLKVPAFYAPKVREWMGLINAADYVVSVDTAAFHFAGGIGKPVVGIFTWADGGVYGKYYPTKTIVQLHRDIHPDHQCGPCYYWPQCPFTKKPEKPCLVNITIKMIMDGIEEMLARYPHATSNPRSFVAI